jgi:site-specific DNA-methyltransferase (adenine-specific)
MIKPYYEHAGITIYHGDCRDILPTLPKVDLVLTDPPYGIGDRMNGGTWGAKQKYSDFREWDKVPDPMVFDWILNMSCRQIIWGGNYFTLPISRGWLVWDKRNAVPTMSDCELAWTSLDKPSKRLSLGVGVHEFNHPTQKPIELFLWCLGYAGSGNLVLDPFMGSGTTLVAAKQLGRQAIGIELEEKYCEIAVKRLSQEVLPLRGEPVPPLNTQKSLLDCEAI